MSLSSEERQELRGRVSEALREKAKGWREEPRPGRERETIWDDEATEPVYPPEQMWADIHQLVGANEALQSDVARLGKERDFWRRLVLLPHDCGTCGTQLNKDNRSVRYCSDECRQVARRKQYRVSKRVSYKRKQAAVLTAGGDPS